MTIEQRAECRCGCYSGGCDAPGGCRCGRTCPCQQPETLEIPREEDEGFSDAIGAVMSEHRTIDRGVIQVTICQHGVDLTARACRLCEPLSSNPLPGCMMPDGAEPCIAYQRLTAELDKKLSPEIYRALKVDLRNIMAERDRLRAALERYGRHDCSGMPDDPQLRCKATRMGGGPCTCGFEAALAGAQAIPCDSALDNRAQPDETSPVPCCSAIAAGKGFHMQDCPAVNTPGKCSHDGFRYCRKCGETLEHF